MTMMLIQRQNAVPKWLRTASSHIALIEEFLWSLDKSQDNSQLLPGVHTLFLHVHFGSSGCSMQSLHHRNYMIGEHPGEQKFFTECCIRYMEIEYHRTLLKYL